LRHVWLRETSESEPLMKHRKGRRHQNQGFKGTLGRTWEQPAY
jgi:hypothetical protein